MQKINKKALSDIVTGVLLILLGITLIIVVSFSVNKLIDTQMSPEPCLFVEMENPIQISRACYNGEEIEVTLVQTRQFKINNLDFVLDSSAYTCGCGSCRILNFGEVKTYYLNENSESIKILIDGCPAKESQIVPC